MVWDAVDGAVRYTFEGHEAPVYSLCLHARQQIPFLFSTAIDGKIKAWLFNNKDSKVDYTAPGHWYTTLAYSVDGERLFSCGTSKDGETYLVEWNESEGTIKRTYDGFCKKSTGVVQFATVNNKYLAAGDEFKVKFWSMDDTSMLTETDVEGLLPVSPCVRSNRCGNLLAVSTNNNCFKILGNADGLGLLRSASRRTPRYVPDAITKPPMNKPLEQTRATVGTSAAIIDQGISVETTVGSQNGGSRSSVDPKLRSIDDSIEKSMLSKLIEVKEPSQCTSLRIPDSLPSTKVSRLTYIDSGAGLLALASDGVHKVWKWQKTDRNVTGQATGCVAPELLPSTMINEMDDRNLGEVVHCFALSKNGSYVISASGGKVRLFNTVSFKRMAIVMIPPPTATCFAFLPADNNSIAIGMDDSSIGVYNVQLLQKTSLVTCHQGRITDLAFSSTHDVLISSGADAQLCLWKTGVWEKVCSKFLQIPSSQLSGPPAEIRIQFHNDQTHILVVHRALLAIYDALKLECLKQWVPQNCIITHATYSCDGNIIYASSMDGSISIFVDLELRCRINSTAYLNTELSSSVYPLVIAAHPSVRSQFAVGLTDGGVQVFEPLESAGSWETIPQLERSVEVNASFSQDT